MTIIIMSTAARIETPSIHPYRMPSFAIPNTNDIRAATQSIWIISSRKLTEIWIEEYLRAAKGFEATIWQVGCHRTNALDLNGPESLSKDLAK
jgi:hypothetical protein